MPSVLIKFIRKCEYGSALKCDQIPLPPDKKSTNIRRPYRQSLLDVNPAALWATFFRVRIKKICDGHFNSVRIFVFFIIEQSRYFRVRINKPHPRSPPSAVQATALPSSVRPLAGKSSSARQNRPHRQTHLHSRWPIHLLFHSQRTHLLPILSIQPILASLLHGWLPNHATSSPWVPALSAGRWHHVLAASSSLSHHRGMNRIEACHPDNRTAPAP